MASGTITLSSTRDELAGRINWSSSSLGSEENASSVYAELQVKRTDGYTTTGTWTGYLNIGGDERSISVSKSISSSWTTLKSFTKQISHNDDGTGTCYISGRGNGPSGTSMSGHYVSGNRTVTLDTIPRYVTGTSLRALSTTINTAQIKWWTSQTCSKIKYGLNPNNMTEVSVNTNTGTFNLTGLTPGTGYTIYFNAKRKDSGLYLPQNFTYQFTTTDIARLTTVPDVNIGQSHTIQMYASPSLGYTVNLKLCQLNGTLIENLGAVTQTTTRKTITPTASNIYPLAWNTNNYKAKYVLTTTQNGVSYTSEKQFTLKVVNSNPIIPNNIFTTAEIRTTDSLAGTNTVIKGYSSLYLAFNSSALAQPQNSAQITKYTIVMGTKSTILQTRTPTTATLNNIDNNILTLTVTDSRGNSTSTTRTFTMLNYFDPTIQSLTIERSLSGVGSEATLNFSGTFWNNNFGVQTNDITFIKYYYRESGTSTWIEGETTLSITKSGNNWSGSAVVKGDLGAEGFDVSKTYNILLSIKDKLISTLDLSVKYVTTVLPSGTPVLAIASGNKLAQGAKYDTSLGGDFQMNGDVYLNRILINPLLGTQIVTQTGTDLDNYTEDGTYFFSVTHAPSNIPSGLNGWLIVMKSSDSNITKQIWLRAGAVDINDHETFVRTKITTWSNWARLLTSKDKDVYSTSETLTNKVWIDNKPVYRKCFSVTSTANINTGISHDTITKMECIAKQSGQDSWRNIPWLFTMNDTIQSGAWAGGFYYTSGQIRFQMGSNLANIEKINIIMEYTKS